MSTISDHARTNLKTLLHNPYPGRCLIMGHDLHGNVIQVYFISGRSADSQNRYLKMDTRNHGRVSTEAIDITKVKKPELTLYDAMIEGDTDDGVWAIVSNGRQTTDIAKDEGRIHNKTMWRRTFEPDGPNFTPRISGVVRQDGTFVFNTLVKSEWIVSETEDGPADRTLYAYDNIPNGLGRGLMTYTGDTNVAGHLEPFRGEPFILPLSGGINEIHQQYWEIVGEHRISIVVKRFPKGGGASEIQVTNRF